MTEQLSLFDVMRAPPVRKPVDPNGDVYQGKIHTVLKLNHPKMAWSQARIEIHPIRESWMWATEFNTGTGGAGYRVGEQVALA